MNKSQKGFSAVEAILILIIVGILGGVGWYVYNSNKKASSSLDAASQSSQSVAATPKKADATASWSTYKASDGTFSVKYPKDLLTKDCNGNGIFFGLAMTQDALLQDCDGQPSPPWGATIKFTSYAKPPGFEPQGSDNLNRQASDSESSYKYTTAQLSGHEVEKAVTVNKDDAAIMSGSTVITYRYYDDKEVWEADYTKLPSQKDLTTEFETMIKTWQF